MFRLPKSMNMQAGLRLSLRNSAPGLSITVRGKAEQPVALY